MVGTRGAAAAASSSGGSDQDAGGTSRAQASSSSAKPSPAAATFGGNAEKGGNLNIAKVSHDDVVSNIHKFSFKIRPFWAGNFNLVSLRRIRLL